MSLINVFKIDENKVEKLQESLSEMCALFDKSITVDNVSIYATLYVKNVQKKDPVKWEWVLEEFSAGEIKKRKAGVGCCIYKIR